MASSTPLKGIQESFFVCSVCLDQFKEPKQLPCLHRYCRDCLKTLIKASDDGTIKCPTCTQDYVIPVNGVDEFKIDFHMNSMLEFIQLQKSFENKELKKCISCSIKTTVTAYCFKCRNFLCDQCSQRHLKNPMFTDHQPHILNLENIEANNLTIENLSTLTENPRCHIHIKQPAQLCCRTCQNVPICVTCIYGMHKYHDLCDVTEISKSERKSLQLICDELNKHKSNLYELPEKVKATKQRLTDNFSKETEKLRIQFEEQVNKIKAKLDENTAKQERKEKHDTIMEPEIGIYVKECEEFKKKHDEIETNLNSILSRLERNLKNITIAHELRIQKNEKELQVILDYCKQIIKRYEHLTATSSSVLVSNDEWTDAQCIPHIRAASEPLVEEMKQEFPELASLSDFGTTDITKGIFDGVTITLHEESVIDVEEIKAKSWRIDSITCTKDGSVVMTGVVPYDYPRITVINRKGEIQRQDKIKTKNAFAYRYCCYLSGFRVATVCRPDEIGIYDIRDGSFQYENISGINRWPIGQYARCIATDPVKKHILVGTNSRYMYVVNDHLLPNRIIMLPDGIGLSTDITVHGANLLIYDVNNSKVCLVTMEESISKLMYEVSVNNWIPRSVCTDKSGFIYMLLYVSMSGQCLLAQYSQDGRKLLETRPVDKDSRFVTALTAFGEDKLLILTVHSGKLYTYGLEAT